jgi:octopamine receptor
VNNNASPPVGSPKSSASSAGSPTGTGTLYAVHYSGSEPGSVFKRDPSCHLRVSGGGGRNAFRRGRRCNSAEAQPRIVVDPIAHKELSPSPSYDDQANKPKLISKMGKRNIKAQVKRFRMETKAAKTLGIIVGGFIVCWLPFFTMYLVRAFCGDDCIHPTVFSVLFWLGYCNSAINPCIYALFSKDFRFAFKRIICRCLCSGERLTRDSRYRRRGSDGSQLGANTRRSDKTSSSNNVHLPPQHHSDSDPNNEPCSDSR